MISCGRSGRKRDPDDDDARAAGTSHSYPRSGVQTGRRAAAATGSTATTTATFHPGRPGRIQSAAPACSNES